MDLRRRLIQGSAWSSGSSAVSQIANFIAIAVAARHVGPEGFGTFAIVAVTIELTREFMTAGLPDYLVRQRSWNSSLASTALLFQLVMGLALGMAMAAVGASLSLTGSASLGMVFIALSPIYLLDATSSVFAARMQNAFRFRALSLCGLLSSVLGSLVMIVAAVSGLGLWSLVAGRAAGSGVNTLLVVASARWRPQRPLSLQLLKATLHRSVGLAGANMVGALNLRVTDFIVGAYAGAAALGVYSIAGRGLTVTLSTIIAPSQRVALSAFSELGSSSQITRALLSMLRMSSLIAFPILVGLSAIAPEFILIAFGEGWEAAEIPMTILTLVGVPAVLTYLLSPTLTAVDRPRALFRFAVTMATLSALFAFISAPFGVNAVAVGFLLRSLIGGMIAAMLLKSAIGVAPVDILRSLSAAAVSAGAMFVLVVFTRPHVEDMHLAARTAVLIALGASVYITVLLLWYRSRLSVLFQQGGRLDGPSS